MSERKLYFPGLGGNRYEISLEELQKQAYKGKIKRDDKIIVAKIKDGITTEVETTCGKIKVVAESFDQGEADRKAEAEKKAAEKRAREEEKASQKKEKEEAKTRKKIEIEQSKLVNKNAEALKMLSLSGEEAFIEAHEGTTFLLNLVKSFLWINGFSISVIVLVGLGICIFAGPVGWLVGILFLLIGVPLIINFFRTTYNICKIWLWRPLQIAVYQVNSLKEPFVEATSGFKFPIVGSNKSDSSANWDSNSDNSARQESTSETVPVPPQES